MNLSAREKREQAARQSGAQASADIAPNDPGQATALVVLAAPPIIDRLRNIREGLDAGTLPITAELAEECSTLVRAGHELLNAAGQAQSAE